MDPVTGAHKGILSIVVLLSSCGLLTSGTFLPRSATLGRKVVEKLVGLHLWRPLEEKFGKREVSQYPRLKSNVDFKADLIPWGIYRPSITLQDWSLKWMSSDLTASQDEGNRDERQNKKYHLWGLARKGAVPAGNQKRAVDTTSWVPGWRKKRSIVVADDAAFREKSKMLTAMERQKWLNSYMQKFLVVNSD